MANNGAPRDHAGGARCTAAMPMPTVRTLETLLAFDDGNQERFGVNRKRAGSKSKRSDNNGDRDASHRTDAQHGASEIRSNSHANQHHQPDAVATELRSLEALLTIDNSLTPNRTPYLEKSRGQEKRAKSGSIVSEPTVPPKQHNVQKPQNGSLQHVEGTGVEFSDLSYTVVKEQKLKDGVWITREARLLRGITGVASKGEITALMGVSGAGKSTLLDVLAGRVTNGTLDGFTMVDGLPVTPALMKRMSTYVTRDDQLFPMLTVWETLWFAAEVRLHRGMSSAEKRDRVTKLIDQLGLTNARNTYIGDEKTRGVSSGEKRRVSIGVDIIHGPALLFMDEPTFGLDCTMAYSVIDKIHDIAKAGSTVILTIHQPSYRILEHLNRLIVLARGQLVYQGSPNHLSTHLAGFGRQVPRGENSIEYLLDLILEYDESPYGLQPLVVYNLDGTKVDTEQDAPSRSIRTPGSIHRQKPQSPAQLVYTIKESEMQFSKSPLGYDSTSFKAADDQSIEVMELGEQPIQDLDDAYDHSIYRDGPKLAAQYYKGLVGGLVDRLKFPRASPLRMMPPSPVLLKTPGRMMQPSPLGRRTPMSMTAPSPLQRASTSTVEESPLRRTASRILLRSPTMTQRSQTDTVTSEIGPATPSLLSSERTVTEQDYHISEEDSMLGPKFANIWCREVLILMSRVLLNFQRSPKLFLFRQTIFGFMVATFFLRVRHHLLDRSGVTSIIAYFIFTVCLFFLSSMDAVPAFIMGRFIYIRETSHNAYRASAYVIANAIVSLPFLAFQAMTYALITWFVLGLNEHMGAEAFWFFFLVLFVSLFCAGSVVLCVSALVPNYILAYTIVITFSSLSLLFCGYFVHRNKIPGYWIWLHYLSTLKYPYEAMVINQFGDPKHQLCYFRPNDSSVCSLTGKNLLEGLHITQLTKWESLAILLAMAVFYRFLFYCALHFGSKNQRSWIHRFAPVNWISGSLF